MGCFALYSLKNLDQAVAVETKGGSCQGVVEGTSVGNVERND